MMISKIKNRSTKVINKVRRKKDDVPLRITNDTIDVHREHVLSGGRKFKYPMQYAKHKLVYNALIILGSVVVVFGFITWWQLYKTETNEDFFYRVTTIFPLPVASIDGEQVPFKDYLMKYKASLYYTENIEKVDLKNQDGKAILDYFKKSSMHEALLNSYARKIARQNNLILNSKDIDNLIKNQRLSTTGEVSPQTYNAVVLEYYNWTEDEYRYAIENVLTRQIAAYFLDSEAKDISNQIDSLIKSGNTNLSSIVNEHNAKSSRKIEFNDVGLVPRNNNDAGLAAKAIELKKDEVSETFKPLSGDGYYFVKQVEINDTKVRYQYIKIPLNALESKVSDLEKSNKVQYYISMP